MLMMMEPMAGTITEVSFDDIDWTGNCANDSAGTKSM